MSELRHVMLSMGERLTEEEIEDMIAYVDKNSDGKIDYEGNVLSIFQVVVFLFP